MPRDRISKLGMPEAPPFFPEKNAALGDRDAGFPTLG